MNTPSEQDVAQDRPGLLSRLGGWLRPWKRNNGSGDDGVSQAELTWPRRRTGQISRLEEAFDKLVGLIDTIDRHTQVQSERSEQLVAQTRRMADTLAQNQGLDRQRTEAVELLADQFRNQTRQMQQVAEAVEALPRTIKGQSEQLGQIRDQLEAQLEAQLSSAQGIRQLAGTAESLRSLADDHRRQFQELHESSQTANIHIVKALERQGRWLAIVLAVALAVSLASAAAVVWLLLKLH